jgi:hypothetical protein
MRPLVMMEVSMKMMACMWIIMLQKLIYLRLPNQWCHECCLFGHFVKSWPLFAHLFQLKAIRHQLEVGTHALIWNRILLIKTPFAQMRKGNIGSQLIAQTTCFDYSPVVGENHPIFQISLPIQFDEKYLV